MPTSCYIYGLCDPVTQEIFYVGKTHNIRLRLKKHLMDATKNKTPVQARIKSILDRNMKPVWYNLEHVSQAASAEREQYFIEKYKATLVNVRNGGGGRSYDI